MGTATLATMAHARHMGLLFVSAFSLAVACEGNPSRTEGPPTNPDAPSSPAPDENYGDDYVGYRSASEAEQAAAVDQGDPSIPTNTGTGGASAAFGGYYAATGGSVPMGGASTGGSLPAGGTLSTGGFVAAVGGAAGAGAWGGTGATIAVGGTGLAASAGAPATAEPTAGAAGAGAGGAGASYAARGTAPLAGNYPGGASPAARASTGGASANAADREGSGGAKILKAVLVEENPFFVAAEDATSTFSIDQDSGSYTLARAAILDGVLPPAELVRIEEFLNYFHFHYAEPAEDEPLSVYSEIAPCPWNAERELLMLGVQGPELVLAEQPPINLVFLIDVSGSMGEPNKLSLLKRGFRMLAAQLRPEDTVSIVTYADQVRVVLDGAHDSAVLIGAINSLTAGGSTNGEGGIQKAYELAVEHYIEGGTNRVLLGTDGDFNVGISSIEELTAFIASKRDTGVFLSVYGFGDAWGGGNTRDPVVEQLADNGNGAYFYIDSDEEARRAFIHTVSGSLFTVAKDVKLQVEFNPHHVKGYRLIGYENRVLSDSAFSNDAVDAGELGAGLSVTALYEIIPTESHEAVPTPLSGTVPAAVTEAEDDVAEGELFPPLGADQYVAIRLRYKESDSDTSQLMTLARSVDQRRPHPSPKLVFAASIAEFATLLHGSQYLTVVPVGEVIEQLQSVAALDREGAIAEARRLLVDAAGLME